MKKKQQPIAVDANSCVGSSAFDPEELSLVAAREILEQVLDSADSECLSLHLDRIKHRFIVFTYLSDLLILSQLALPEHEPAPPSEPATLLFSAEPVCTQLQDLIVTPNRRHSCAGNCDANRDTDKGEAARRAIDDFAEIAAGTTCEEVIARATEKRRLPTRTAALQTERGRDHRHQRPRSSASCRRTEGRGAAAARDRSEDKDGQCEN